MPVEGRFGEPALAFTFDALDGSAIATRVVGTRLASSNSFGELVSQLAGRPLAVGERIDLASFVGRHYVVVVGESGVESIRPASEKEVASD